MEKKIKRQTKHWFFDLNITATKYEDQSIDILHEDTGIKIHIPEETAMANMSNVKSLVSHFICGFWWKDKKHCCADHRETA